MRTDKIYWMGVLATEEEVKSNDLHRTNCFVNRYNDLQFYLKVISRMPGERANEIYVVCYSNRIENDEVIDHEELEEEQRVENYVNQLRKFYFGFTYEKNTAGYNVAKSVDIIPISEQGYIDQTFCAIPRIISNKPVFSNDKVYMDFEELKNAVVNKENICKLDKYDTSDLENIPYILFYDSEKMEYMVLGNFTSFTYEISRGIAFEYVELKTFKFEDDWYDSVLHFSKNGSIAYVDSYLHNRKIMTGLESEKTEIVNKVELEVIVDEKIEHEIDEKNGEWEFIEYFEAITRQSGLFYDKRDLINFHTAMKSSSLVILSGLSGTGKSRLVECYANALGLEANNGFYPIPVRPSWSDDSDLIGFVDSMHMVYRPSDTGFINTLIEADKEQNKLFIICLDEMNLARVEHYFSQFLSILEMPEETRKLRLYASEYKSRLYNSDKYPEVINSTFPA